MSGINTTDVIDGEIIDDAATTELTVAPAVPPTLFRTDDPVEVLSRASEVANALAPCIEQRKLYAVISGKKHVTIEGWTTLGAMLGVTPVCVWTRSLDDGSGWEARVEARTLDGRVIGAAEAQCTRAEKMWSRRDDYALRSMAQTRAASKSLGSVLRFVITLAGYSGTPAEEMPREASPLPRTQPPAPKAEETITKQAAQQLVDRAWKIEDAKANFRLALSHKLGREAGVCSTKAKAVEAAAELTTSQAEAVDHWIARKEAEING